MGNNMLMKQHIGVWSLICALACVCALAAAPLQAFAVELTGGTLRADLKTPTVSSVASSSAGTLTANVNKNYYDTDGIECQVALDPAFSNQPITIQSTVNTVTFTGLKQGKKYYVRAREYYTESGQLYYTNWSATATGTVAIANGKSAIKGTWKIVKSNSSSVNSTIKKNKRISKKAKATFTFQNNGKILFKDYNKKKYDFSNSWGKWVALSKKAGQTVLSGSPNVTLKVSGKSLIIRNGAMKIVCKR